MHLNIAQSLNEKTSCQSWKIKNHEAYLQSLEKYVTKLLESQALTAVII